MKDKETQLGRNGPDAIKLREAEYGTFLIIGFFGTSHSIRLTPAMARRIIEGLSKWLEGKDA